MVPIQRRPEEATHRLGLGHWEGDLVAGRRGGSQVGTLVERRSRYLLLLHLPEVRALTVPSLR
jgi:transposase, IS30 family